MRAIVLSFASALVLAAQAAPSLAAPSPDDGDRDKITEHKRRAKDHAKHHEELLATAEWRAAAELGDAEAQFTVARRLERGLGVMDFPDLRQRAKEEAAGFDEKALAQGYAPAVARIEKQAQRGSGAAQGDLAKALEARGEWEAAVDFYRAAYIQGRLDGPALAHLADLLCEGRVEAEPGETLALYQKAIDAGDGAAEAGLARAYFEGRGGVRRDATAGRKVLERGAASGHVVAILELGRRYEEGDGLGRDPGKALALYAKSKDREVVLARAQLLASGQGVRRDTKLAATLLEGPARAGWFPAVDELLELANIGEVAAEVTVGDMYLRGQGMEQDAVEAARWYTAAADHGDPRALYALGQLYLRGEGVDADPVRARALFTRASAAGSAEATRALAR